jgi:hypothetical protein
MTVEREREIDGGQNRRRAACSAWLWSEWLSARGEGGGWRSVGEEMRRGKKFRGI